MVSNKHPTHLATAASRCEERALDDLLESFFFSLVPFCSHPRDIIGRLRTVSQTSADGKTSNILSSRTGSYSRSGSCNLYPSKSKLILWAKYLLKVKAWGSAWHKLILNLQMVCRPTAMMRSRVHSIQPAHLEPVHSSPVPVPPSCMTSRTRPALLSSAAAPPSCTTGELNSAVQVLWAAPLKRMAKDCTASTGSRGTGKSNRPCIAYLCR